MCVSASLTNPRSMQCYVCPYYYDSWDKYLICSKLTILYISQHQQFNHIKIKRTIFFMHSGFVNGYQLLCDAHAVPEQHRETVGLFLFYALSSFSAFFFLCVWNSDSLICFTWCLYSCVNNLERAVDSVSWFPDKTSVCLLYYCTHWWHQNVLIVFTVTLNSY